MKSNLFSARICAVLVFQFLVVGLFGQQVTTGLILDEQSEAAYSKTETFGVFYGSDTEEEYGVSLPKSVNLKKFCPRPNDQGLVGSCVGQAIGYGAMTIIESARKGRTDVEATTREAYSALYIFNQIKMGDCSGGSRFDDAFNIVLKPKGNVKFKRFEGEAMRCGMSPTAAHHQTAKTARVGSYQRLFDLYDSWAKKVISVKSVLANRNPVVVGMKVTSNFENYRGQTANNNEFVTLEGVPIGGHAMVVVGYDDQKQAFLLMNSWGTSWGKQGFAWVKYNDFVNRTAEAYNLTFANPPSPTPQPVTNTVNLSGNFYLRYPQYGGSEITYQKAEVANRGKYYLTTKSWNVGQRFQLVANDLPKDKYVYIFSIDAKQAWHVHFPRNAELLNSPNPDFGFLEGPMIPYEKSVIIIPNPQKALIKDVDGTDYLVVLFCNQPIENASLKKAIEKISKDSGEIPDRLERVFGNQLIPWNNITYQQLAMTFNAKSSQGFIAPLILKVDGQ